MESPNQKNLDISCPWGDAKRRELADMDTVEELKTFAMRLIRFSENQAAAFGVELRTVGKVSSDRR